MLNHTTLLFAPNLPGIKWNVNKFALIIAQKSPDNHTYLFLISTFTALIHQLLANRKYCLRFWSYGDHLSQSITEKLTKSNMSDYPPLHPNFVTNGKVMKHEYFPLSVLIIRFSFNISFDSFKGKMLLQFHQQKRLTPWGFPSPHHWGPYLDNHTTLLFALFLPVKNGN